MANTYKALSTVTVGAGGAASISFTNIPQTYTDLVLKFSTRDGRTGIAVSDIRFNFNGTGVGTNISGRYLYGNGSSVTSTTVSASGELAFGTAVGATASTFGNAEVYIPNYIAGVNKSVSSDSVAETNATGGYQLLLAGLWSNTAPITSIEMTPFTSPFAQYSTATLYGVFNADVSSAPATPTIGTASVASGTSASITFTPVSNAASYTMTSTPSSITATGTTSPITVSGLTQGTAYTFKVKSNNPFGSSAESAASNSVTPIVYGFESIATTSIGAGGASSVTFSGIPSTFSHLQIRLLARDNRTGYSNDLLKITFNGDTATNYSAHRFYGDGGGTGAGANTNLSYMENWIISTDTASANVFGASVIDILDYKDTNKFKTLRSLGGFDNNGDGYVAMNSGNWRSTSAITSVTITMASGTSFKQYSRFALYGIKVA